MSDSNLALNNDNSGYISAIIAEFGPSAASQATELQEQGFTVEDAIEYLRGQGLVESSAKPSTPAPSNLAHSAPAAPLASTYTASAPHAANTAAPQIISQVAYNQGWNQQKPLVDAVVAASVQGAHDATVDSIQRGQAQMQENTTNLLAGWLGII